jgi:hypothetical protein
MLASCCGTSSNGSASPSCSSPTICAVVRADLRHRVAVMQGRPDRRERADRGALSPLPSTTTPANCSPPFPVGSGSGGEPPRVILGRSVAETRESHDQIAGFRDGRVKPDHDELSRTLAQMIGDPRMPLDPALRDQHSSLPSKRACRADRLLPGDDPLPLDARRRAHRPGLHLPRAQDTRLHHGSASRWIARRSAAIPRGAPFSGYAFRGADHRRDPSSARGEGPLPDPAVACRRGADRSGRALDASALRSRDRGRLALWPRRRRHEGPVAPPISIVSTRSGGSACSRREPSMSSLWSRRNRPATVR